MSIENNPNDAGGFPVGEPVPGYYTDVLDDLINLLMKVGQVRGLQKDYFKSRSHIALSDSKQAEKEIDLFIKSLANKYKKPVLLQPPIQPDLFPSDIKESEQSAPRPGYEKTEMNFESGRFKKIVFNSYEHRFEVTFRNDSVYYYFGSMETMLSPIWDRWLLSETPSRFFNERIKGILPYKKIEKE